MYFCPKQNKMKRLKEILKLVISYILAIILIPIALICKIFRK